MKYLVAVSGGVDSVVLIDKLVNEHEHELIVAHFDHGIRDDSSNDARFVRLLAEKYSLPFIGTREALGVHASEETARKRRYAFLYSAAKENAATIVTAHHADDVVETIAINLQRGTGWRGLAVLDNPHIIRPLLHLRKQELLAYAVDRRLEWVEDSTNAEDAYLRNRLRRTIMRELPTEARTKLLVLWQKQVEIKASIEAELAVFVRADDSYNRYIFIQSPSDVASEILRSLIVTRTKLSPTRPQLDRALLAIKTARSGTKYDVGGGVLLQFTTDSFIVQTP